MVYGQKEPKKAWKLIGFGYATLFPDDSETID